MKIGYNFVHIFLVFSVSAWVMLKMSSLHSGCPKCLFFYRKSKQTHDLDMIYNKNIQIGQIQDKISTLIL